MNKSTLIYLTLIVTTFPFLQANGANSPTTCENLCRQEYIEQIVNNDKTMLKIENYENSEFRMKKKRLRITSYAYKQIPDIKIDLVHKRKVTSAATNFGKRYQKTEFTKVPGGIRFDYFLESSENTACKYILTMHISDILDNDLDSDRTFFYTIQKNYPDTSACPKENKMLLPSGTSAGSGRN